MGGPGGGKRAKGKQQAKKGKSKRGSGNPAKAAQEAKKAAAAAQEKAAANPFGTPGGEEVDYEKAAAELNLPGDFSKFLK